VTKARRKNDTVSGTLNPPQPPTMINCEQPATIRELLDALHIPQSDDPNDVEGTNSQKAAVRRWLVKLRMSEPVKMPNRILLAQLWLRQWINDAEYDVYFPYKSDQ
jgi:hypothetical protein